MTRINFFFFVCLSKTTTEKCISTTKYGALFVILYFGTAENSLNKQLNKKIQQLYLDENATSKRIVLVIKKTESCTTLGKKDGRNFSATHVYISFFFFF